MAALTSHHAQRKLDEILKSDEQVLWVHERGKAPMSDKLFNAFSLAVSIAWTLTFVGFASSWTFSTRILWLFAVPPFSLLLYLGLFSILAFGWAIYRWNSFVYVLTNQRVVILNSVRPILVDTYLPGDINALSAHGEEERGTVFLRHPHPRLDTAKWILFRRLRLSLMHDRFHDIPKPFDVAGLIRSGLKSPAKESIAP